jgi:hypothetical protein
MSDQDTTQDAPDSTEADEQTTTQDEPTDSPEETDKDDAWDPERAKRKISKVNSENKTLRERATAAEKKAEGVDDLQQQNGSLGAENLRLRVGYELGLPLEIAMRLQGGDRDAMVKDAEKLVELIAPSKRPTTQKPTEALRGGLEPDKDPEETDLKKLGERMFSR